MSISQAAPPLDAPRPVDSVLQGVVTSPADALERWESAVQSSYGYTVPRRLLWLLDFVVQAVAVLAAREIAPAIQSLAAGGGPLRSHWLPWLALPDASTLGVFRPFSELLWIPLVMVPSTLLFMQLLGGYRPLLEQSRTRLLVSSVGAPFLALSLVTVLVTSLRIERTSRVFLYSTMALAALGIIAYRVAIREYKRYRLGGGYYARNMILIAPSTALPRLQDHFARTGQEGLNRLRGYLAVPEVRAGAGLELAGSELPLPCLGPVSTLGDLLVHRPVHEIVAVPSAGSAGSEGWLTQVIEQCDFFRVTLRVVPKELLYWHTKDVCVAMRAASLPLPEIVLRPRHFDSDAVFVKRLFDIALSLSLLLLLAPVFLIIAAAIKLTTPKLPVFYPWRVVGYKGRLFTGYKFTTMSADADDRKAALMHLNEMSGPVFKIKNDPRITSLGKFLRRFSLNELPQLWSVLKGDMSMVGPRPASPTELKRYELWHKRKLCVQPGITCLWQIRGRNKISNFDDWVRMDFEYIDNWSLWLDCRIVMRTVCAVIKGTGS